MFLFRRRGIYYIKYLDEAENRIRRVSTHCKLKQDATKFLSRFESELLALTCRHLMYHYEVSGPVKHRQPHLRCCPRLLLRQQRARNL